jgi:sec1 family domain-containing protein 1
VVQSPPVPSPEVLLMLETVASIAKLLKLNQSTDQPSDTTIDHPTTDSSSLLNDNGEPIWKVLVFDNLGKDVISSVLRVDDLRSCGVTLYL